MPNKNGYPNPDPAIQALKQTVNLVELVEAAGVKLEGTAPKQKGLCPLHAEDSPSFTVDATAQVWHCWGCGKGGDVFDFLAAKDGMAFPQALAHLRKLTGLPTPPKARRTSRAAGSHASSPPAQEEPPTPLALATPSAVADFPAPAAPSAPTSKATDKAESLPGGFTRRELMERVVALYQSRLHNTQEGQAYLKQRHLDSSELWDTFRIGYADGALLNTMGKDSEVKAALQALGVVTPEGKELLYGCVVVPLEDPDGGVVGLYGRRIWPDATVPHLYLPGPRQGILNAQAFKASAHIILTESVFDALSVWVAGHRNVTCIYGANGFTRQHNELLERFGTQQVTFCLDNDEVGEKATQALVHKLSARRIQCITVSLPVKDANAMLCQHGPDALSQALSLSQSLSKDAPSTEDGANRTPDGFLMQWGELLYRVTPRAPFTGGRLKVAMQVELNDQSYSDTITDLVSQRFRQAFAKPAARTLGVSRDEVEQHLAAILREAQSWVQSQRASGPEHTNPFCAPPPPPMTDDCRAKAMDLLCHPQLMRIIVEHMEALGHVGDDNAKLLVYLVASSRRREEPLSAIILSQSGAGKSTMSALVQRLMPPEELVSLTRVSPKAFTYMPKDGIKQKAVTMEEGVGVSDDAAYAVRILQTAPMFRSAVTKTDPATGETTTRVYEVEGPIAYIETTTNPRPSHENATRAFEVTLNESIEQTRRIHDMQRQRRSEAYLLQTAASHVDPDDICCLHQDAQRLLLPKLVLNRFDTWTDDGKLLSHLVFPHNRIRNRRDHERFMSLVDTVAFLHQYQREHGVLQRPDGPVPYIVATVEDYRIAYELAQGVLSVTLHELSRHGQDLKALIARMLAQQTQGDVDAMTETVFTRRQLRDFSDWEDHRLRQTLEELVNLEHLAMVSGGGRGATVRYRLLPDADDGPGLMGLTTPDELEARMAEQIPTTTPTHGGALNGNGAS